MSEITHYSEGIDGIMILGRGPGGQSFAVMAPTIKDAIGQAIDHGNPYDSTADTLKHIMRVRDLLGEFAIALIDRSAEHDQSKLGPEEKRLFDEMTPKLKELEYGSEEYKASLAKLGPALEHHYRFNSHHPEHHDNGIADMTLHDIVEMFCDWKAASERTKGGSFLTSLPQNQKRFQMDEQLTAIFENTARRLGWDKS